MQTIIISYCPELHRWIPVARKTQNDQLLHNWHQRLTGLLSLVKVFLQMHLWRTHEATDQLPICNAGFSFSYIGHPYKKLESNPPCLFTSNSIRSEVIGSCLSREHYWEINASSLDCDLNLIRRFYFLRLYHHPRWLRL